MMVVMIDDVCMMMDDDGFLFQWIQFSATNNESFVSHFLDGQTAK